MAFGDVSGPGNQHESPSNLGASQSPYGFYMQIAMNLSFYAFLHFFHHISMTVKSNWAPEKHVRVRLVHLWKAICGVVVLNKRIQLSVAFSSTFPWRKWDLKLKV